MQENVCLSFGKGCVNESRRISDLRDMVCVYEVGLLKCSSVIARSTLLMLV